jgi:FG-GAP-like repeat
MGASPSTDLRRGPALIPWGNRGPGLMAIDFDGDGRSDLVQQWKDGSGYLRFILYRSNGDGTFTQSIAPSNNVGFETAGSTGTPGPGLIPRDLNGDGRTDFVQPYEAQSIPRSGFASGSKSGALASLRERRAGWPRRRDPGVSTGRSHRRAANRRPVAPRRISRCNFHLRWSSRRAESYAAQGTCRCARLVCSAAVALRAFWSMHVERMNWSGMEHAKYGGASGLREGDDSPLKTSSREARRCRFLAMDPPLAIDPPVSPRPFGGEMSR